MDPATPIDRYLIKIDRRSKEISRPEPIVLSEAELAEAIFAATGQNLACSTRFTDGALSISYKVAVQESPDVAYVVQLRHHGYVASMDSLMTLISKTIDPHILPVPPVYPIPGEMKRQEATGMGRQITQLIPGMMASSVYPRLSHGERLVWCGRWHSHSKLAGRSSCQNLASSVSSPPLKSVASSFSELDLIDTRVSAAHFLPCASTLERISEPRLSP